MNLNLPNTLIFAYYAWRDPVFQSAVMTYFRKMPVEAGRQFVLLTFENDRFPISDQEIAAIEQDLSVHHIHWYRLQWRTGRWKPLLKVLDLIEAIWTGRKLIRKYHLRTVYSEGFPGAILSHWLCRFTGTAHVVHTFEPHADYMMEGGTWTSRSWEYQLLKLMERTVAKRAKLLITATEAYKQVINRWGFTTPVMVAPSLVDTTHFYFREADRERIRGQRQAAPTDVVLVYLGKLGGMYMEEELFQLFRQCEQHPKLTFHYWIFSGDPSERIQAWFDHYQIPTEKFWIKKLAPAEVPSHLSAADVGLVGVRPFPSKRFCSPIKTGEYWACGLPVLIPAGVGDDFEQVQTHGLGAVVANFSDPVNWESLLAIPRKHCMEWGRRLRGMDTWDYTKWQKHLWQDLTVDELARRAAELEKGS